MNKNSKFLFVGLTLLLLLCLSIGAISATEVNDTTTTHVSNTQPSTQDMISSEVVKTPEKITTGKTTNKNPTKKTTKTDKQTKKAVETIQTANNYETLKTAWDNIQTSGDNTTQYTINLKNGKYQFEEELTAKPSNNTYHITINGQNVDKTIFDGQNKTRLFNLNNTKQIIKINNITFANGFNETQAGAMYINSTTILNNTKFINNTVNIANGTANGGAIYARTNLTVNNSSFINNRVMCNNNTANTFTGNGGAISSNGLATIIFNLELCEFINNTIIASESIPTMNANGGAISNTGAGAINIKNCDFFNNSAKTGAAINIGYTWGKKSLSILACVFANNTATTQPNIYIGSQSLNPVISANYYPDNSNVSNIYVQTNGKNSNYTFNQKTKQIRISCLIDSSLYFGSITSLGRGHSLNLTSNSTLINTTGIKFTPENNYSILLNISNLPANHENITLYVNGIEATHITYDHTNVIFNNITSKPGDKIILNATFTTSDSKLIPNGKVSFKINGKTVGYTNIKYGTATLNYTIPDNYSSKDYILTTTYGGSNKFIEARTNSTLHLEKLATKTNITTSIDKNTLKITVDPKDENENTVNNGKICVKINGKTIETLKITGKTIVNFTIPKSWNNREIKILAIYGENNNHKESRTEIKTKLVLPNMKTIKTDEVTNNYYVSANTGSDTNPGTQSSPFKTIQKAINTVNTNKQNANIYLDGVFKGVGNTNLTVPGDLHINFIGVGNSSIDGEVNYTIKTTLDEGEYYWGSSPEWYPYNNGKGNWAMNITRGSGLITINNFTIKNCWNPGESSINAYKTATVDNYGNLEVNNVSFIFNHGGVGASIRNNNGANINVTNSLFEANRKSSSTGNYGAGIYNNGTAIVINSTFQKNYARWGTITNDKQLTIINSTIRDNIAYDGASTYKTGSGITINTGSTTFDATYNITSITTIIDGNTFINNDQLDIHADTGYTTIKNNIFNQSTGITATGNQNITFNFINNTFDSPIGSTLYTSLSSSDKLIITLSASGNYKYNIDSNTVINLNGTLSKSLSVSSSNSNITNNNLSRMIKINGNNNIITGNNIITTMDQYAISLDDYKNNTVTNNNLIATTLKGNSAVNYTSTTNKVENNTPQVTELIIDDETFYKFFDDDGNLLNTYNNVEQIQIIGSLTNKNVNINQKISIIQKGKFSSYNITITTNKESEITLLNITNTNNEPVIILNGDNSIVKTTNLTTNNNYTIIANSENNNITQNKLLADILVGDESVKTDKTNTIENNTPAYKNYILSEENFDTYFNTDGTIKDMPVVEVHFLVNGTIQNKNIILNNNKPVIITNYKNAKLVNTSIKTIENTTLNISHITIENKDKIAFNLTSKENIISYNNITSNTTIINAINTTTLNIEYNNIQAKATENIKIINIEDVIKTLNLNYNNITTQSNTTAQCIKILNHEKTIQGLNNQISNNNIIVNATNTTGLEIENLQINNRIQYNEITLFGDKNIGMKLINITRNNQYSSTVYDNDITLNSANSKALVIEKMNDTYGADINYNRFYLNNNNSTAITINQIVNLTITNRNKILMNGSDNIAIYSNNSNLLSIYGNPIESLININDNIAPIILNNTTQANITKNNITTISKYAIIINETSNNNQIIDNNLFADDNLGDDSISNPNPDNNKVLNNNPTITTYFYLNEKTYNQFFDENENLRDEIPAGLKIIATGNLYDKILNINKPITIIANGITYTNTIINLTSEANNINITGLTMKGDSQLIIGSNNSNINIPSMNCYKDNNKPILIINGNNNNITIGNIYLTPTVKLNTTVIEITGDKNYIHFTDTISTSSICDNIIGILLNNANNNIIDHTSALWIYGLNTTPVFFNNSNNNTIRISQFDLKKSEENKGIILVNSSYNKFKGRIGTYNIKSNTVSSLLKVENDSNFNNFEELSFDGRGIYSTPIYIINSHYNVFRGNGYIFENVLGYAINITEGVGNNITYNRIKTATLEGNDAVIQENKNDTINNMVMYNHGKTIKSTVLNITIPDTIKVYDNVIINISVSYRNGTNWNSPCVPVETGHAIFEVNGKQINTIELVNGLAEINYTVQPEDGEILTVKVSYEDQTLKYTFSSNTTTRTIELLDSKIIIANTTNTGINSKVTAIVLDEKGNIVYDGNVTFILGAINQTVLISNGIAQATFDTSNLKAGEYNITATFNGNSICAVSDNIATLTITPFDVNIIVNPVTVKSGNKVLLTAKVTDKNGNTVNSGRVVFKLNGKTLKDDKGNVLYANVANGTATMEYFVPVNFSAKDYKLTAVASDKTYNRAETTTTLTVNKTTPKAVLPTTAKRSKNTQITVKFTDDKNNNIIGESKVCIKLNGKTIQNTKSVNGTVTFNLDLTNYKNSKYNMTVVCGENSRYNTCRTTSVLTLQ